MITIYGKPTCVYCVKAKNLATQYDLRFEYLDISVPENLDSLKNAMPDASTIPQIWWNDKHVGGYQEFAEMIQNTIGGYGEGKL